MLELSYHQRRSRQLNRKGKCHKCSKPLAANSKTRCAECLSKHSAHSRISRSTNHGKWARMIGKATCSVVQGYFKQSKHLNWNYKDVEAKWGPDVIYYREERLVVDHKMPLSCAKTLDSQVDHEMAAYLSALDNLQLITCQANSLKTNTVEKEINAKVKILRRNGVFGRALYFRLLSEFEGRLDL
jgi:hypothetical protein